MNRLLAGAACALAVTQFASNATSLLPGSRFALRLTSANAPTRVAALGSGRLEDGFYEVPIDARPGRAVIVAASSSGIAVRNIRVLAPPAGAAIAVASYDDGIVFHDPRTFAVLGTLATGGSPSDIATLGRDIAATDTDGTAVTIVGTAPWRVRDVLGVPLGDEVAADAPQRALFVTERELDGRGGLARIVGDRVAGVVTGATAEGIAIDAHLERAYVADANDGAVAIVDTRAMRVIGRISRIPRAFSLALSRDGRRLYAVSNQGARTLFGTAGFVSEIALDPTPRIIARSGPLAFPLGVALDEQRHALYVTDEEADVIDVLDASTLRPRRASLPTCRIPWKPLLDIRSSRLYVPCAGSDEVDVIDVRTLRRVNGAPFATGGYPLAVASVR